MSAAGIPVLGIGHNGHLAWGFTSGLSDEDDLYAETLTGTESYRHKGGSRAMDCRNEQFDFRAPVTDLPDLVGTPGRLSGTRTERICRTVHGPVQERAGGTAYARRYAIWGRELETLVGLSQLNDAKTVRQADAALQNVTWNENVMAADERGDIGFWHPGLHPLRPTGYDERLPYPGTGEAEWRGLLDRRKTPHVINPRQGYLFNWNNVPSEGWTAGDSEATERLAGPYHRSVFLRRLVARVAQKPSYAASRAIDRSSGSTAQQRPLFSKRLRLARKGARGGGASVLDTLLGWDGSYARTDSRGTVPAGVATWEEFKDRAEAIALFAITKRARPGHRLAGGQARHLAPVRHLQRRGVRAAHPVARSAAPGGRAHPGGAGQALRQRRPRPPGASRGACTTSPSRARRTSRSCRSSTAAPGSSRWAWVPDTFGAPVPWVETDSLSFVARHESDQTGSVERLLDDLERFRTALEPRFERYPGGRGDVHPRSLMLSLAHPWLPAARMVSAPAGRRYLAGFYTTREMHVLSPTALEARASGVPGSREALALTPRNEYAHLVVGANNPSLPPPFTPGTFRRYLRMAWISEGSATYLSGQVPHMRAAVARRMREGGRPLFLPAARDALVLGGTVFDFLAREAGAAAADQLALSRKPGVRR